MDRVCIKNKILFLSLIWTPNSLIWDFLKLLCVSLKSNYSIFLLPIIEKVNETVCVRWYSDVECVVQRGTNELKKYLRSRIEPKVPPQQTPPPVFRPASGTSGIIGGDGVGVDRFRIASTKALEYWSVNN